MNSQILPTQIPINNLHKHTSFVFAMTLHQVVLYYNQDKYEKIKGQKFPNWIDKCREIEVRHIEYLVTGGADKNICLWEVESLTQPEPKVVVLKQNRDLLREQQPQEVHENIEFTDDQLRFGHYVIDKQVNHYEYITCLTSVKLDQFTSYLIAGYESNQIIRYHIEGEYWVTGSNQMRHLIEKNNFCESILLTGHNDSVVSLVYMHGYLYSGGEDMQVIQQDIDGKMIRKFYFDSAISQMIKYQDYLVFMYQSVETVEQIQQEDVNYLVINYIMFFGRNENYKIKIRPTAQPQSTIELAYNASDPINCFEVRIANLGQSITYGTVSGQLGRMPFPLEQDQEITDNCHKKDEQLGQTAWINSTYINNAVQIDTYKYYANQSGAVNIHKFDSEITALKWHNDQLLVITKSSNGSNLSIINLIQIYQILVILLKEFCTLSFAFFWQKFKITMIRTKRVTHIKCIYRICYMYHKSK